MTPAELPDETGHFLTIDELAARSRLSKTTLYRLKADGRLPFFQRCPGGKLRFPADAIEKAMAGSPSPPADTPLHAERLPSASEMPKPQPRKRLSGRRSNWESGDF